MNLAPHLPALQVVVPLIAAPLTVLLRQRSVAFAVALVASWLALAISLLLWWQVANTGIISYAIGSWPAPWGIEYRIDRLNSFILVLVAGISALVLPFSRASIESEVAAQQHYLFYTMFV
jgi:multicomponent Na+:H+ antiporter subunit D